VPAPKPEAVSADDSTVRVLPASLEKTERITVSPQKQAEAVKKSVRPARRGRGKMTFLAILTVFGAVAAGGLGYFFLGDGLSFSEFSMLSLGGIKSKKASFSTQLERKPGKADAGTSAAGEVKGHQAAVQPAAPAVPAVPAKTSIESSANENTRKALETVKNYKLSGGRGAVAGWFANSFLSTSAGGSNEEWSATSLHGDIFVVQYRLLRPKQDPLIYQFEVDVARNLIVRGINNNAIELLDLAPKAAARTVSAPKLRSRKPVLPSRKPRRIPILPLPDEPAAGAVQENPTGFESPAPGKNEKVRYIIAQESDEELF
jgi:hypothetical protein